MQHDRRADILAEARMRHGKGRRFADRGMAQQRLLDIVWRDFFATAIYDFLRTADDREKALFIDAAEIAGVQPTVSESAWHAIDIVEEVAGHDAGSAQHHLADQSW